LKHYRPYCFTHNANACRPGRPATPLERIVFKQAPQWFGILLVSSLAFGSIGIDAIAQTAPSDSDVQVSAEEALGRAKDAINKKDYPTAFLWARKSAELGNLRGEVGVAMLYRDGVGVARDYAQAMHWFRVAADQGSDEAQKDLALMYYDGLGVPRDYVQALAWFRKAAEQGNAEAQLKIAVMYANGIGAQENDAQANIWYRKAADQGNAIAQGALGARYYSGGVGLPQDYEQALSWLLKSANQGVAEAQALAGIIYLGNEHGGLGRVPQNFAEATSWLQKAAAQGNVEAEFDIGLIYQHGLGVEVDKAKAAEWYRKAAAQGHQTAEKRLAELQEEKARTTKIPAALGAKCLLDPTIMGLARENNKEEFDRRYDECLRSTWRRVNGSAPFPSD